MSDFEVIDTYEIGPLRFQLLQSISTCANHPTVTLNAPTGTIILGGGAYVDWNGPCSPITPVGNLLTAMYPNDNLTTWTVASKDHIKASPARIFAYAIVAQMQDGTPIPGELYKVVSGTSTTPSSSPTLRVDVPAEFTVVGGGAKVNYGTGNGNILFASHPTPGLGGWVGFSKDHLEFDPSTITVWAIGIRTAFLSKYQLRVTSFNSTSSPIAHHPRQTLVVPNFYLTGVGARLNWSGAGSLLTASFPQDRQTVVAEGTDFVESDPATITTFAIGFAG